MKRSQALALLAAATLTSGAGTPASGASLPSPVTDADYYDSGRPSDAKVELGRLLFFDKVTSGNRNISCATCHHPEHATSDGLALPLGEGPTGLGPARRPGDAIEAAVHERVPRNSPALFNVGAREFVRMFHDGRVETDPEGYYEGGFITPAKWKLPTGLDNVLAAQAMFPVTSPAEMAGQKGENPIAEAKSLNNAAGPGGVWEIVSNRLREVPEYIDRFEAAFPEAVRTLEDVNWVLAANAIAAFETAAFRADGSPFDAYLRGEETALDDAARRGMELFYGKANCHTCHAGKFQTDHDFHAIAMPQVGPGKADGRDAGYWSATGIQAFLEDFGRARVTVRDEDLYRFRTPSLRNVALTGPWGHSGAYDSLEAVVRHHLSPVEALEAYRPAADLLTPIPAVVELTGSGSRFQQTWLTGNRLAGYAERDGWVQSNDVLRARIASANELDPVALSDAEVEDLLAFLESLTDPASTDLAHLVPESVPSGLPVED